MFCFLFLDCKQLEIVSSGVELQTISVEGSIAFRQDEQRLYVRMADGKWKSIPVGEFLDLYGVFVNGSCLFTIHSLWMKS